MAFEIPNEFIKAVTESAEKTEKRFEIMKVWDNRYDVWKIPINEVKCGKTPWRVNKISNFSKQKGHNLKPRKLFIRKMPRCYRLHYWTIMENFLISHPKWNLGNSYPKSNTWVAQISYQQVNLIRPYSLSNQS